jgi:protein-L-isoaspartate(D-aspartate) O-methyltransferase
MDTAAARNNMVDSQVRPNKVIDPRILEAMRQIPRERFVPPEMAALAYADEDVPLGGGRYLMEPMVIARLVQAAKVRRGERALVVGAGSGYGAALLAALGAQVIALEQDAALLDRARAALARAALPGIAAAVTLVSGKLTAGWPAGTPYDIMLIDGAAEEVPAALVGQLKRDGGRIVAVRAVPGQVSHAALGEVVEGPGGAGVAWQALFDCATPVLPALRLTPGFVF